MLRRGNSWLTGLRVDVNKLALFQQVWNHLETVLQDVWLTTVRSLSC